MLKCLLQVFLALNKGRSKTIMPSAPKDEGYTSPTSPVEETDTEVLPDPDLGPDIIPGIAGNPVRCESKL